MGYMIPGRETKYGYQPPMYYTGHGPVGGIRGLSKVDEPFYKELESGRDSVTYLIEGTCPECGCNRIRESVLMPGVVDEMVAHCAACEHEIGSTL